MTRQHLLCLAIELACYAAIWYWIGPGPAITLYAIGNLRLRTHSYEKNGRAVYITRLADAHWVDDQ